MSSLEWEIEGFLPTILNKVIPVAELVPLSAHEPFFIKYGFGFFIVTFLCALTSYASISDMTHISKLILHNQSKFFHINKLKNSFLKKLEPRVISPLINYYNYDMIVEN